MTAAVRAVATVVAMTAAVEVVAVKATAAAVKGMGTAGAKEETRATAVPAVAAKATGIAVVAVRETAIATVTVRETEIAEEMPVEAAKAATTAEAARVMEVRAMGALLEVADREPGTAVKEKEAAAAIPGAAAPVEMLVALEAQATRRSVGSGICTWKS
jgi:hypothetical protein